LSRGREEKKEQKKKRNAKGENKNFTPKQTHINLLD
jgi:hypothetical protein